jgi:hypothetical protein
VPAILVGEVTALAFGDTVAAMVVTEDGVAASDGGIRETLVTFQLCTWILCPSSAARTISSWCDSFM